MLASFALALRSDCDGRHAREKEEELKRRHEIHFGTIQIPMGETVTFSKTGARYVVASGTGSRERRGYSVCSRKRAVLNSATDSSVDGGCVLTKSGTSGSSGPTEKTLRTTCQQYMS